MIGGAAVAHVDNDMYLPPTRAKSGDYLILTKALGTQVAV